ncbi:MAG: lysine--tRNA ligase, partial [Alphaproteobacteria bacterium]
MSGMRSVAMESNAWPFAEARKVLKRLGGQAPDQGYVLFETGYGPSGLPHIGTFGEVARTTMVRRAFEVLSDIPTKLIAFSDDMDGLRRVPENIPNRDMVAKYLDLPLTAIPDPFGEYDSFGAHNNARLRAFLDTFGFDYEFVSATECYKSGRFDDVKMKVLERYDAVMAVILPT